MLKPADALKICKSTEKRLRTLTTNQGASTSSRTEAPQPPPRCSAGPLLGIPEVSWPFQKFEGLLINKLPNPQKGIPRGDSWQPVKRSCSSVSSVRFSKAL